MRPFATLTSRLVVTAVALVAVVSVLIGTIATLAMRTQLLERLDDDVHALARSAGRPGPPDAGRNGAPGTLQIVLAADGSSQGGVLGDRYDAVDTISDTDAIADVPADDEVHTVAVPGHGSYRVIAVSGRSAATGRSATLVTGLPTAHVDDTIAGLVRSEALLTLLGVLAAAGAGTVVVRRQLRPLREVAATAHTVAGLPLDTGDIGITGRVPERLTDERTEVGRVGNALNTLLEHVESSLAARHRSEQQVRQFVADASHELRTPLTTIAGYAELARKHPEDADAARVALAKVEEESGRMTSLVQDLLLLARLDAGRPLEHRDVDLTRLLIEAVSDARVVDPERRWQLVLPGDADGGTPVAVTGDEQRLHQVVTNLLGNASRYTPAGTTVTVRVLPHGFEVHDDGPGFPPGLDPFERFARGDESRTGGASGLGLAIVRAIVEAHGGTVSLHSVAGDTTVSVTLPH